MIHNIRNHCRACGASSLRKFLSLGPTPLANSFLNSQDEFASEASYPLDVYFCEGCSLVQLLDVIDPEVLFRNYIYVTGTSDEIAVHNKDYARTIVEYFHLNPEDLVVEVASNDGSLLKCFQQLDVKVLGIEPATNIAAMANASGIKTINVFFNRTTALEILEMSGRAKIVAGNNVLAHVNDTQDFLQGCKELLTPDGLVVIEVPYLRELIERLEYDTIYHEHLCYFSATTLACLCNAVGLSMVRIDRVPVHGGSLRMYAGLADYYGGHSKDVLSLIEDEQNLGMSSYRYYESFAMMAESSRRSILGLLRSLTDAGKTIAGYGAPAKGNTLLNYCGIGTTLLPYTVDKSSLKVGRYTPGMHIPVLPVNTLLERQPDFVLILAWNFAEEIIRQQKAYHDRGGRFIIPIPELKVV